jgi:hypothetical protein
MPVAIGTSSLFGLSEEVAYGTAVAPSRWLEFLPGETLQRRANFVESQAIGGSTTRNAQRGAKRLATTQDAGGSISMEVPSRGFGLLLKHALGGTPTVVQQGATAAWLQTHALGAIADRSLTLQKQFRDAGGTAVKALTYLGSVITAIEFTITPGDGLLRCTIEFDCRQEVDTVAAAVASFVASDPFTYAMGNVFTVAGTQVACARDARIRIENPFVLDRYCLGTSGLKGRPVDSAKPVVTGTFVADFEDSTYYDLFKNNTAAALVLTFTGAEIAVGHNATISFSVPEIRVSGDSPTIADTGIITQNVNFGGWANPAGDPAITITYKSLDTAA